MPKKIMPVGAALIACCLGCGDKPGPGGGSSGGGRGATGGASRPAATAGGLTLDYWNGVNSLPRQIAPDMKAGPKQQVWALREAARVIRSNPTLGVDPDVTDWTHRMATLLDQRADLIENSRNPALLAEAFFRGAQGDPFGVGIELNQAERSWVTNFRSVSREGHQLRAKLTARYGIEFPTP